MKIRSFAPSQHQPDVQTAPQERKVVPEVIIKHADLYARAWEYETENSIFDSVHKKRNTPYLHKITVQSNLANDETSTIPATIRESSQEILPRANGLSDGIDTVQ